MIASESRLDVYLKKNECCVGFGLRSERCTREVSSLKGRKEGAVVITWRKEIGRCSVDPSRLNVPNNPFHPTRGNDQILLQV